MKKQLSFILLTVLTLLLAACGDDNITTKPVKDDTLSIYTTVYPLQYFTERIGAELVSVKSVYPPGSNEHTFEPTQKDMIALADSDLFFYIGLGLEGFVEKAENTLAKEDVELIAVASDVSEEDLHISTGHTHAEASLKNGHNHDEDSNHEAEHDAHVWLSPVISQQLAAVIKDELVAAMPEQEQLLNANYEALVSDLQQLHAEFEEMANATKSKTFFVSHAAFGYLAGHYGFNQVPVAGLNSQSEPSQKELMAIVDLAKKEDIHYIFFEQNVSSNLAQVIQKEVGAETLILHNLSVLTPEDTKNKETYFTLMRENIRTLKKALN